LRGASRKAEELSVSQEWFCSMALLTYSVSK
jgi:hypothetical protein